MRIAIRNGTEIGYDLHEVAAMLGQRNVHSTEGRVLIRTLADYFRHNNLIEQRNTGDGYDVVASGAIRAYCYDHDLNVPPDLLGTSPSYEEMPAFVRKILRDEGAISDATPEALPDRSTSVHADERRHGGARPEVEYVERYVSDCQKRGLTVHAMKQRFVRHVHEQMEGKAQNCSFIDYDPIRSTFTVWGASGAKREVSLASVQRSITSADKRMRKRQHR